MILDRIMDGFSKIMYYSDAYVPTPITCFSDLNKMHSVHGKHFIFLGVCCVFCCEIQMPADCSWHCSDSANLRDICDPDPRLMLFQRQIAFFLLNFYGAF